MSPSSTMLGFGVLFALFVLLLPTVAIIFFYSRSGDFVGDALQFTKRLAATNSPENIQSNSRDSSSNTPYASHTPQQSLDINQQGKPPFQTPLADYLNKLRDIIRRMPGASAFLAPNVIQELGITDQQQKKIQNIVDATAEAMGKLREQLNDKSVQMQETINQELLDIARDSALKLLTPEQQARWQKLIAENPQHENPPIKEEKK